METMHLNRSSHIFSMVFHHQAILFQRNFPRDWDNSTSTTSGESSEFTPRWKPWSCFHRTCWSFLVAWVIFWHRTRWMVMFGVVWGWGWGGDGGDGGIPPKCWWKWWCFCEICQVDYGRSTQNLYERKDGQEKCRKVGRLMFNRIELKWWEKSDKEATCDEDDEEDGTMIVL